MNKFSYSKKKIYKKKKKGGRMWMYYDWRSLHKFPRGIMKNVGMTLELHVSLHYARH